MDLVSTPLSSFGSMVDTTVFVITIIDVFVIVLLLVLWTRGRKKGIGILLAVGRSKAEIIGQFLTENILIALLSMFTSAGLSITFAVYSIGVILVCLSVIVASYTVTE